MSSESPFLVQQACAIPFRWIAGHAEVCLVTTIKKRRWIFPKGLVKPGELASTTALKEAREEAGLSGRIRGDVIGSYEFEKCGVRFLVSCFLMHVNRQSRTWQESAVRQRRWLPLDQALTAIGQKGQRAVFAAAQQLIASYTPLRQGSRGRKRA